MIIAVVGMSSRTNVTRNSLYLSLADLSFSGISIAPGVDPEDLTLDQAITVSKVRFSRTFKLRNGHGTYQVPSWHMPHLPSSRSINYSPRPASSPFTTASSKVTESSLSALPFWQLSKCAGSSLSFSVWSFYASPFRNGGTF